MANRILLTFDLEEFDLPLEYGQTIPECEQINITNIGLQRLLKILARENISATFFTTSFYADRNEDLVRNISLKHEIASHSDSHSSFKNSDSHTSKASLERITGKQINGFRMPRFQKTEMTNLKAAGYLYDSSVNPTYIPGRYNNIWAQRNKHVDLMSDLIEIPVSVSPIIRFPLFWLSFKNIPVSVYLMMCRNAIRKDSYLNLCFHPWEFGDLDHIKIPWYIKRHSGEQFSKRFEVLLAGLKKMAGFSTISGFLGYQANSGMKG